MADIPVGAKSDWVGHRQRQPNSRPPAVSDAILDRWEPQDLGPVSHVRSLRAGSDTST